MAIIFNIGESLKQSAFNILQEPIKMLMENEKEAFEKESFLSKVFVMKTTDKYQLEDIELYLNQKILHCHTD